jgi:glycine/D-amino acid oxidase-like deaminating enzyme
VATEPPRPIEEACFWLARAPREAETPLVGTVDTDVAIVGGGLTGLWTALHLKALDAARDVVVLERGASGSGASGRNAGILTETIDHSHTLAVAHFGEAEALRLAVLGRENVRELLAFVEGRGIECDLERTGQLQMALNAAQRDDLARSVETARRLGMEHYRLLSQDEAQAQIRSPRYLGALFDPLAVVVDPVKLVRGLAREARRAGIRVFDRTTVTAARKDGTGVCLHAEHGEAKARRVVLATSAYTHRLLPRLRFRFLPLYDYVLVSEPLRPSQRAAIGWSGRQAVTDGRAFFNYYRLTADDRVLWGTSEAAYYRGNRVDESCDHSERHYEALRRSFAWHFPEVGDLGFPYAWGGAICATTRFTPFFGSALGGRVHYGLGYTGHGLGSTHLAGKILAHLALDRKSPLFDLTLVRKQPFPYPPEPLRSLAVAAVSRDLRRVDAGGRPGPLLRLLDAMGIGLSS